VKACGIRRVAVGNKSNLLIRQGSADGFIHGSNSRLSASVISEVIGSYFKAFRRDKEEDVVMFAHDFDISFISGGNGVDSAFIPEIKAMAMEGSGGSIVEDSLIRDLDIKDISENMSGFSGSDSVRDIEGEDKSEDIGCVMDFREIDFRIIRV